VPGRVEENPEGGTGLVLVLGRAESKDRRLGGVELLEVILTFPSGPGCPALFCENGQALST
jgi:hypothetical protein